MKRAVLLLVVVLLLGACGGGDDGGEETGSAAGASSPTAAAGDEDEDEDDASTTTVPPVGGDETLPGFIQDFDRVCTTQVGFSGAASYEAGPGPHPVILFEDYRGGDLIESSRSLPEGWKVEQDSDFEDNRELAEVELIACSSRTSEAPTGVECDFENDEEGTVTLELVDATYDLVVYEARTGEEVHRATLEGSAGGECPFIATFEKGDTTMVSEPEDDAYINALKGVVDP
jgi:hypothetical protein